MTADLKFSDNTAITTKKLCLKSEIKYPAVHKQRVQQAEAGKDITFHKTLEIWSRKKL